jgi:hypothetical protein
MILVFGHFLIPFVLLMSRAAKRNLTVLKMGALWILLMHWIDIYWLVMPNLHQHGAYLSWMDLTATLGIGGIFFWFFLTRYYAHALVPVNDPRLDVSIHMTN